MTKTAIVTGAMGGIGYATAELLLANNFNVVGMDIAPADACTEKSMPWAKTSSTSPATSPRLPTAKPCSTPHSPTSALSMPWSTSQASLPRFAATF
jgi:hypothetical protein